MQKDRKSTLNPVILTSTYPRWGWDTVPSFVEDFATGLAVNFQQVTVIAPHYKGAKTIEKPAANMVVKRFRYFLPSRGEDIVYEGPAVAKISKDPIYILKLSFFMVSSMLSTLKCVASGKGVINAHWILPQGVAAIVVGALTRKKVIVTVHGSDIFMLKGKLMVLVKKQVLKRADAVVVNSKATEKACQAIYPDRIYEIIPMGIDIAKFNVDKRSNTVKQLVTVLFVGRLSSEKGVIYLCQAMKNLRDKGVSNIRLKIVGGGPEQETIEKYIAKNKLNKNISMEGWRQHEDLINFYKTADIFVGPSLSEALGLVFAEAAATQLPVIASDVGGVSDIVEDGKTGFLVAPGDPNVLAEKINLLATNPTLRQSMGRAGAKKVVENFSWAKVVGKYTKLITEIYDA